MAAKFGFKPIFLKPFTLKNICGANFCHEAEGKPIGENEVNGFKKIGGDPQQKTKTMKDSGTKNWQDRQRACKFFGIHSGAAKTLRFSYTLPWGLLAQSRTITNMRCTWVRGSNLFSSQFREYTYRKTGATGKARIETHEERFCAEGKETRSRC